MFLYLRFSQSSSKKSWTEVIINDQQRFYLFVEICGVMLNKLFKMVTPVLCSLKTWFE